LQLPRSLSLALAAALTLAACGDDDAAPSGPVYTDDGRLTVMTRNLYLGADLEPVLAATDGVSLLTATAGVWIAVSNTNNFAQRAGALAAEIAANRPDLVGLQEVSLWRTQTPGDAITGGRTPATAVAFDFLATLLSELSARGVPYEVAEELPLFDLEAPVPLGTGLPPPTMDVRLTDRQVILKISGLPTSNPRGAVFPEATLVPIDVLDPSGGTTTLVIDRGWTAVNATVGGQTIAFYNTHLEAFSELAREAQATVLREVVLDAETVTSLVLVGDLNSDPDGPSPGAYTIVRGADLADLWEDRNPSDTGFTCCFDPNLTVTTRALSERIDHVLWRGALNPVSATRVGEDLADRAGTPPRWPSDHAGVVGTFDP
jgi:endonuclease/exonuclease/phosphatase family metal-dependent hydrolase